MSIRGGCSKLMSALIDLEIKIICCGVSFKRGHFPFLACATRQRRRRHNVFGLSVRLVCSFVRSSVRPYTYCYHDISWTAWAISVKLKGNIHYPYRRLIRFWRWKVKGQGHSRPSTWRRHPRRRWGVEVPFSTFFNDKRLHWLYSLLAVASWWLLYNFNVCIYR